MFIVPSKTRSVSARTRASRVVNQREIPNDALVFARALRAAMQAPDVIMLARNARLRNFYPTTLTWQRETGHLLLSLAAHGRRGETIALIIGAFTASQPAAPVHAFSFPGVAGVSLSSTLACRRWTAFADARVRVSWPSTPPFRT